MTPGLELQGARAQEPAWLTDQDKLDLLRKTVAIGVTDDQFRLFVEVCRSTGLNPFVKQIHAVPRRVGRGANAEVRMTIQVGIDGLRLVAQRSKEYRGQTPPQWCGKDGVWKDVWLAQEAPAAARVGVHRKGFEEPVWGVARFKAYSQTYVDEKGQRRLAGMWLQMDAEQLAKCAEAQALRKAFPQETSGLYIHEEMEQADSEPGNGSEESAAQPRKRRTVAELKPRAGERVPEAKVVAPPADDALSNGESAGAPAPAPADDRRKAERAAYAAMREYGLDVSNPVAVRRHISNVIGRDIQTRTSLSAEEWEKVTNVTRDRIEALKDAGGLGEPEEEAAP